MASENNAEAVRAELEELDARREELAARLEELEAEPSQPSASDQRSRIIELLEELNA